MVTHTHPYWNGLTVHECICLSASETEWIFCVCVCRCKVYSKGVSWHHNPDNRGSWCRSHTLRPEILRHRLTLTHTAQWFVWCLWILLSLLTALSFPSQTEHTKAPPPLSQERFNQLTANLVIWAVILLQLTVHVTEHSTWTCGCVQSPLWQRCSINTVLIEGWTMRWKAAFVFLPLYFNTVFTHTRTRIFGHWTQLMFIQHGERR